MSRDFDAIVIGAGQAGLPLAERLGREGRTVALVERRLIGGTCINDGCTPTKTLVASARAAQFARRAGEFGVVLAGPVGVDMTRVKARADAVVLNAREALETRLRAASGCTLVRGHARFEAPNQVRVGDELLTSSQIFIDVGGRANVPGFPGLDAVDHLTNTSILALDHLPHHLVVVGGSYVGLEFAQIYRRFGAEVTVIEMQPRLIGREDAETSAEIRRILEAEGIQVRVGAECIGFRRIGQDVCVRVECQDGAPEVVGSHVLLAVGRRANTDDLDLDKAGIDTDERGYIKVDDQLRTSAAGVWALGDCNGRGAFTHTAYNDFEIVAANLLDGEARQLSDRITAYALFTDPPLGRVGLTEAEVRRSGRPALVGRRDMAKVARAIEKGETRGFMKVIVDAETRQILGGAILGPGGDEAIHAILDAMYAKAPASVLQKAVHIHPTVSELIPTLLGDLEPLT